uniref:Serine incorporator n=1 Tax=Euplotes harpa TaxID=151035 RepID=A0A7S3N656_9SPIT|mmetsp:Transcript_15204/g.17610  ORF Transcript_15204/g.17610 Transcript_15204/m.17610 type:complete len:178 (+) Transcript_15204:772-1305(+)
MLLYFVYLTWISLASRPTSTCNTFYETTSGTVLQIILGLFFTFLACVILATGTKSDKKDAGNQHKHVPEAQIKNIAAEDEEEDDELEEGKANGEEKKSHVFPVSTATIIFHAYMVFVSIYYCMLISNWGRPTVREDDYDYFIDKWAGFWVKIVGQWVMCLLYLLSLLAPLIFRNREF